ncbi:hypothetical protein BC828DRAFT_392139 [Blastocladiella britannica]|nr:hypothetical protein BC828DRAFT_392139 [Blastocladiella britannica]
MRPVLVLRNAVQRARHGWRSRIHRGRVGEMLLIRGRRPAARALGSRNNCSGGRVDGVVGSSRALSVLCLGRHDDGRRWSGYSSGDHRCRSNNRRR